MSADRFRSVVASTFDAIEQRVNGAANGPLHVLRRKGLEAFSQRGVPTPRHEEWKYTNVLPIVGADYAVPALQEDDQWRMAGDQLTSVLGDNPIVVHIHNGRLQLDAVASHLPSGVSISPLTDAFLTDHPSVASAIASTVPLDDYPFVALNTALTEHGLAIRIAAGVHVQSTIHIVVSASADQQPVLHTPRIVIVADEQSSATIVESHHTLGTQSALACAVTETVVARGAHLQLVKILDDAGDGRHIGFTGAIIHADATFASHVACLSGAFVRNDVVLRLVEPNATGIMNGVSVLSESEYADNHTVVDHMVPHCHSEELYKGVYNDRSVGVFNGKIFVRPQAQKTTAYQSHHALLLSDRAQVNAKPQLEIWADDVRCSHGATTGQLDQDAVFYLQSRGIGKDQAKALMTYAFAADVVERMPLPTLRAFLEQRIARKLKADFGDVLR